MMNFFDIITETNQNRDKATPEDIKEVRRKLSEGTTRTIPDCVSNDKGEYDWQNIAAMVWRRGLKDNKEYTFEQAMKDIGLHNIRRLLPELYYYFWDVASRENVAAHWDRHFQRIDSFDTCESCGSKKNVQWNFCATCGYHYVSKTEYPSPEQMKALEKILLPDLPEDAGKEPETAEAENPTP